MKRSEPLTGIHPSFGPPVVLLHDMFQVGTNATGATTAEFALPLGFRHDVGTGRIAVDVDDPGPRLTGAAKAFWKKTLGGSSIPYGG